MDVSTGLPVLRSNKEVVPAENKSIPVPAEQEKLLALLQENVFPVEILGPQVVELIHQAKLEIVADKKGYKKLQNSKYSIEDIIKSAIAYSVLGSVTKVSKLLGIDFSTIQAWKYKPWWDACLRICRYYHTVDTDIQVRSIRSLALNTLQERLQSSVGLDNKELLQTLRVTELLTTNNDKRLQNQTNTQAEVIDSLKQMKNHLRELSAAYQAKDVTEASKRIPWEQPVSTKGE